MTIIRLTVKKLTRHGNSWALVTDRAILDLLGIDPGKTPLDVSTDGQCLIIAPVRDGQRKKKLEKALEVTNRRFGRMLKRLAD